jgi:3-methyladenine DNA glycosylase/8-oxoguanine DNA glycosylase
LADPLELTCCQSIELFPTAPFNFDATVHKPDHFPSADHEWQPGVRWQTMRWQGIPLGLKVTSLGTVDAPRLDLGVFSEFPLEPAFLEGLAVEIRYRYNLDMDLVHFNRRFQGHPQLGPVIERLRGMRPVNFNSLYEYLVIAIVLQNATVRRSVSMLQALFERYGSLITYDGRQFYSFWEPESLYAATEQELRVLKVGYRAKSLLRVTDAFVRNEIEECSLRHATREEQRQSLLALYGIGPASVGYLLWDVFHQVDEMTHISPWEQKIYSRLFFERPVDDPLPVNELIAYFDEDFAGFRALAVHYFWEDLFWRRKNEPIPWLEELIRL